MENAEWAQLFHRIPKTHHDILAVVMRTGTEIMVQRILRVEDNVVILRGRPSGSTEEGTIMILPLDELVYVAFHKPVLQRELKAIFGDPHQFLERLDMPEEESSATTTIDEKQEQEDVVAEQPAPSAPPAGEERAKPPSKTILLARLRARLNDQNSQGPQ